MDKIENFLNFLREKGFPETKKRLIDIETLLKTEEIITIAGPRRAGKTFLMYYILENLIKKQGYDDNIIFLNLEHRLLQPANLGLLNQVLEYIYRNNLLNYEKVFLFLDEIQVIEKWERWVRSIDDDFKGKIKVFVSGSTFQLTRGKLAKLLTGRHISLTLLPLSFKEFLLFKNFKISAISEISTAKIKGYCEEYMNFGGFPQIILKEDEQTKITLLNHYFEDFLAKDLIINYKIRATPVIKNLVEFLFMNISSYFSFYNTKKWFDSLGVKASLKTIYEFTFHLQDIFLFFFIPIFSKRVRDISKYPRKIYCIDTGLRNYNMSRIPKDFGKLIENMVFLELKRRKREIYYWKNYYGREVDFVLKEGLHVKQLIQICYDVDEYVTKEREVKSLLKASKELKCNNLLIITWDYEGEEEHKGKKIKFVPLWKWLSA